MKNILIIFSLFLSLIILAEDYYKDNVVIVLDGSGSMSESMSGTNMTKMQAAKQALHQVLKQVPDSTNIGLLVFCSYPNADGWLYPLGPKSPQLGKAIDKPVSSGATPLGKYIKLGADRLLKAKKKQHGYGSYKLLIVTDGEASDKNFVDKYVPDVLSRGIIVDVIGVGMNRRHTLATQVNSYRSANDPEALKKAVNEVLAEVSLTNGNTDDEAFELIAPLPDAMAKNMLETLADSGTSPIGTKRMVRVANSVNPKTTAKAKPKQAPKKLSWLKLLGMLFLALIVLVIVKGMMGVKEK